jgi:hypothetical protein
MQERDPVREQGTHAAGTSGAMSAQDERLWSILAHAA